MALQFDIFLDEDGQQPPKRRLGAASTRHAPVLTEVDMVQHLNETGRYRILRKLKPRPIAEAVRPEFAMRGVIIDTETTGLDHRKGEIIEIGAIAFSFVQPAISATSPVFMVACSSRQSPYQPTSSN